MTDILNLLNIDSEIDKVEEGLDMIPQGVSREGYVKDAIPTGSLVYDLITGGGHGPGRLSTLFGPEQGGKSTYSMFAINEATKKGIKCFFLDFESSFDPSYSERMGINLKKCIGNKDKKNKWENNPLLRYYQPNTGEAGFRYIKRVLEKMPDKIILDGTWYLLFPKDRAKELDSKGIKYKKRDKRLLVESPNEGQVQAVFFWDSYAATLPEAREEDDTKSPMAMLARMYSNELPLVKSLIARKRASLVGTNQLRMKIGGYGSPESEPCGESLKHNSDMRIRLRAVSASNFGGKGNVIEEESWNGEGIDRYRGITLETVKNKGFSPWRKSVNRIWFEECGQPGRGIDPVYDTYQYLVETGQIENKKGRYSIAINGYDQKTFTWKEFKRIILDPNFSSVCQDFKLVVAGTPPTEKEGGIEENEKKLKTLVKKLKKLKKLKKPKKSEVDKIQNKISKLQDKIKNPQKSDSEVPKEIQPLRDICKKQMEDGSSFKMYFKTCNKG